MSELRRAIIIGCGKIGGGYNRTADDPNVFTHALAYVRHPAHQLAACVEPVANVRAAFMRKWNVPHGYASVDEAMQAERFEIASVCTPTGTHLGILNRLLSADLKAVFAEKPLDGDAAGARRLGEQFTARGVPVAVNFLRRFDPSMASLKSDIASGRFGKLYSVVGWYDGGVLNNGVHLLDLASFLVGASPTVLQAMKNNGVADADDPAVSALLKIGEAPFHLTARPRGKSSRFELELSFEKAIVTIEEGEFAVRVRQFKPSASFEGALVPERGVWQTTNIGVAMLAALDELANWKPGARLSSDIASASVSVAVASELRRRALEKH
jgi:predicted dehydrogenase